MPIITISRGCFSHGKEIAERVAAELGYGCISKEILVEAARTFHVPQEHLSRSIQEATGILERFTHTRRHFLDCIQAALLDQARNDRIVYHGHAGHLFLAGIRHVLKVRVIAEMKDRVDLVRKKEGLSREKAVQRIENEDRQREAWYHAIYKKDMSDPGLYDMVLHIGRLRIEDACGLICRAASSPRFEATEASRNALNDLALTSRVKTVLEAICDAEVNVRNGVLNIRVKGQKIRHTGFARPGVQQCVQDHIRDDIRREISAAISGIPGIQTTICDIEEPYYV